MNQQQKTDAKRYLRDLINSALRGAGVSETDINELAKKAQFREAQKPMNFYGVSSSLSEADVNELAKKAQELQDAEAAAGRYITITEAVSQSFTKTKVSNEYSNNRPGYTTWYFTD
jgi:hypothetical protein